MDEHHLIRLGSDGLTAQILSFNLLTKKANANGSRGETFDGNFLSFTILSHHSSRLSFLYLLATS